MTALVTNQTRLNRFFAENVSADPGAPAFLATDLPPWMDNRGGFKGIDQMVVWGVGADNQTVLETLYYAWDLTNPALAKGASGSRAFLVRPAITFTWTFGLLKGVLGTPIPLVEFVADTVVPVKLSAQDYIETLTGTALSVESPIDNGVAMVGMPDLGNVVAFGFRRTGGTSTSHNIAVQLGNGRA